jgi:hypothetical protein
MVQAAFTDGADNRGMALAAADLRLAACAAVLERQVALGTSRMLDDQTVIRVRALAGDLARQLVGTDSALVESALVESALVETVRELLAADRAILTHLHALAIETRLATALAARRALDPVLPPLVRRRLDAGAVGDDVAALTTALLAAQTRLSEALRRMRLPLAELPGDLQHMALAIRDAARADQAVVDPQTRPVPQDETHGRLVLLRRVLAGLGDDMGLALRIDEAGVALFLSALALASGFPREVVTLACVEDDAIRLALLLRAAGLSRDEAAGQLLAIRPDADPALVALDDDSHVAERLLAGHPV